MKTIREIHDQFSKKLLSPVELVRDYLQRAKDSSLNAFLTLSEDKAIQQAKFADQLLARDGERALSRYPLLGIPVGLKDNLVTEGIRTTCASKMLDSYVPPYSATVVKKLEAAGAVFVGKLNMDEFAMGGSNENSAYGPVKHPTHPDRVPGGSSGGSAAAVRAGLCTVALGSDTGGSIRLPASYCGVMGLKPTYGAVSRFGLVAFASSLDQIGPLAHSAEDAARVFDVIQGHDPLDSTSLQAPRALTERLLSEPLDWKKLRVGIPSAQVLSVLAPAVQQAQQRSLEWLKKQGATLTEVALPSSEHAVAVYYIVAVSEASSNLARYDGVRYGKRPEGVLEAGDLAKYYEEVRSGFGAEVKRRILLGTFALSSGYREAYYRRACQVRHLIQLDFMRAFEQVDFILSPVATTTAYKLGEKISDPLQMYLNDLFTIPANLAGIPALSVPYGQDSEGLPVSLQLQGPALSEGLLLQVAQAFEKDQQGVTV